MRNHDTGILYHVGCVHFCLKHNLAGDYYGLVNLLVTLRNNAKTETEKNRYRLWRLICLLCFDENKNRKAMDVVQWKRLVHAYYRYLHG